MRVGRTARPSRRLAGAPPLTPRLVWYDGHLIQDDSRQIHTTLGLAPLTSGGAQSRARIPLVRSVLLERVDDALALGYVLFTTFEVELVETRLQH